MHQAAAAEKQEFDHTVYSKHGKKYADIWASYRPIEMVDQEYRTPQLAVREVFQSFGFEECACLGER